jgi:hypothetical protein
MRAREERRDGAGLKCAAKAAVMRSMLLVEGATCLRRMGTPDITFLGLRKKATSRLAAERAVAADMETVVIRITHAQ